MIPPCYFSILLGFTSTPKDTLRLSQRIIRIHLRYTLRPRVSQGTLGGARSALLRCNCLRFFRAATRVRFQITNIYMLRYFDPTTWSEPRYVEEYPVARDKWLTDIVHCPGKTGYATCEVLDMQFASKGLSRYDAVHGVGDGGGEMKG